MESLQQISDIRRYFGVCTYKLRMGSTLELCGFRYESNKVDDRE